MKRITAKLAIAAITFLIGVALVRALFVPAYSIPETAYCPAESVKEIPQTVTVPDEQLADAEKLWDTQQVGPNFDFTGAECGYVPASADEKPVKKSTGSRASKKRR